MRVQAAADRKRTKKLKETSLVDEFPMCGDAMDSLVMRVRADVHRRDQRQQEDWRPDSWRAPVLIASASAEATDAVASPAADTPTPDSDREVENQIPPPETCSEQPDEPEANREQVDEANESPPTEDVSEVGVSLSMR